MMKYKIIYNWDKNNEKSGPELLTSKACHKYLRKLGFYQRGGCFYERPKDGKEACFSVVNDM